MADKFEGMNPDELYEYGNELIRKGNKEEAGECWQKAAENGHAASMRELGVCYVEGACGYAQDNEKAFEYFSKAADAGNVDALVDLAVCYQRGIGAKVNEGEFVKMIKKAADLGHPEACLNVGMFCLIGQFGFKSDYEIAFKYLCVAAEKGIPQAEYVVGGCLEFGKGTERNLAEAAGWYRRAAKAGISDANTSLERLGFPAVK